MATRPTLPPGEAPLNAATVDRLLANLGADMVLVGGQALAFWMSRFGVDADGVAISNDGDALGSVERATQLAESLQARLELPARSSRTAIVAQLRLPGPGGDARNIDVLHQLYTIAGPRKSAEFTRRVIAGSVEVEWRPGRLIRVMEPFDVLESRAQNAVGLLEDKGPHVVTQSRWAVLVAQEALLRLARDAASAQRLGAQLQRVYTLARSQVGKRLLAERGVELLEAVDVEALRALAPTHSRQLDAIKRSAAQRRGP
jgi:hypothetical protein